MNFTPECAPRFLFSMFNTPSSNFCTTLYGAIGETMALVGVVATILLIVAWRRARTRMQVAARLEP